MRALLALLAAALVLLPPAAADAQDDCGTGADAPYSPQEGAVLQLPADCSGAITTGDERDAYRFEAPPGVHVTIAITTAPGDTVNVYAWSPDHGEGEGPSFAGFGVGSFSFDSTEPGLWSFYLEVCNGADCGAGVGSYHLSVRAEGDPWPTLRAEGNLTLGLPAGLSVNGALGPSRHDGLDGAWIDLGRETRGDEFAALRFAGCSDCLSVAFADADHQGVSGSGACGHRDGLLECFVPAGARWAFVSAHEGARLSYALTLWRAP